MAGAWDCERLDMFFDHLLHSIGKNLRDSVPDRWIDRHVFPNGDLPSIGQVGDRWTACSCARTCTTSAPTTTRP